MPKQTKAKLEAQVQTCTTQLQVAITTLRQQTRQIDTIKQLVQLIQQGVAVDELLQVTVDLLGETLPVRCGLLLNSNGEYTKRCYFNFINETEEFISVYTSLYDRYKASLIQGKAVGFFCVKNEEYLQLSQFPNVSIVPVFWQENFWGGIMLHGFEQRQWSKSEIAFVQIVATHCGSALAQSQLTQQLQQAKKSLQETELRLQNITANFELNQQTTEILESITDGFVAVDMNWYLTYMNPQAESLMVNKTGEELLGKVIWEIYPETVSTQIYYELHRAAAERVTIQLEEHYLPSDRWFQVRVYPAKNGLSIYFRDITQCKHRDFELPQLYTQLEEKTKRLDTVVNSTPDGLYLLDREKRFIYINPACLQLLRREEADVLGKTGEELGILPETMTPHNARLDRVFASGQTLTEEIDYIHSQTGLKHYASYSLTPIFKGNSWVEMILVTHRDITEFKKTKVALLKSDERFSKAFHGNPIASSIATFPEARLLNVNTSWLQVFGYSLEEVLGRTTIELGLWSSLHDRTHTVQQLQQIGAVRDLEIRFCTKSGEVRDGLMNGEIIELNGECCTLVMLIDITDRKRAEVALKESEQKYRNLVETSQGMIWSVDVQGRFTFVNQAVRQFYDCEPEEIIGRAFCEFTSPKQTPKDREVFERVLAGESLFGYEAECLRKDGTVLYVTTNAVVLRDEAGNVLGTMGTTLDVTHFKQTEAALRATHAKLSTILDNAIAVIINFRVFADGDWEYDYFSSGAETIYGYTPKELIADKYLWLSRVAHEDVETIFKTAGESIFAERTNQIEYQFRHKDGTLRWNSFTMFSKRDEAADCWVVTTVDIDISDRKLAEKQLKTSLQEKEALLKEVHHRVKNNLQVISSLLDFQAQHIREPQTLESFQASQNRVKSIALIHEKLYQSESLAKVNLADYIHSLTTHLIQTYTLNPDNITLQFRLDEILCNLDIAIPCGLLINELVSNALKHGLPGNAKGKIWVELTLRGVGNLESNVPKFTIVVGNDGIKLAKLPLMGSVESVGFQLIYALIQQLHGKIEIEQSRGTEFKIII